MDQRKVNVLDREYCDDIKRKNKPITLSHRKNTVFNFLVYIYCHRDVVIT
ncbi:putative rossmann-like alpha/beta/alpha sandwich protein [Helianthus anomalus]